MLEAQVRKQPKGEEMKQSALVGNDERQLDQSQSSNRFSLPRFDKEQARSRVAEFKAVLEGRKVLFYNDIDTIESAKDYRMKFALMLEQMAKNDALESLDFLVSTIADLTNPASNLEVQDKVHEWGYLGEAYIGAKTVGYLLLDALELEYQIHQAKVQEQCQKDCFEIQARLRYKGIGEEKEVKATASSISLSSNNIELARLRLYQKQEMVFREQISYVKRATDAISDLYGLMKIVSYQNNGMNAMSLREGM